MSLISSLDTTNVESIRASSELTTERETVRVSTLRKSLDSSEMHRSASKTPRTLPDHVQKLKSIYSTYQHDGQPLSKEAIYHAKQKYGILNTPAYHKTLGLGDTGSESADLAARLANRSKKSIDEPVGPTIEQKALNEASKITFSKIPLTLPEETPIKVNLGLKGKRDFLTRSAAQKALASDFSSNNSTVSVSKKSKSAASAAIAFGNSFDANSVNPQHPAGFKSLDLSKVLDGAERRAIKRINGRLYPEKVNFQNGLLTGKEGGVSKANKEVFKKGTLKKLERSAEEFLEAQPGDGRQGLNDRQYMYAKSAADAVKDLDPRALVDPDFAAKELQKKAYLQQISSPLVLHEAQILANRKLRDIDSNDAYLILFGNQSYNKLAVDIALKHYSANQEQKKKIYLGGGLWITPEEVNTVAKNLVSPVINEISDRANRQRNVDQDIAKRTSILDQEYENWKFMERTKELNDRQILLAVESKRQQEKLAKQAENGQTYNLLINNMGAELEEKEKALQTVKQEREHLMVELQGMLTKNVSEEEGDVRDWSESCQRDLENTNIEQAQAARLYPDDLRVSTYGYDKLLDEHDRVHGQIERLNVSINEHRSVIHNFEERIDTGRALTATREQKFGSGGHLMDATVNDPVVILAEKAKQEAELASEEAMLQQLEIDEMVNKRKIKLYEHKIRLRKEKLSSTRSGNVTEGEEGLRNDVAQDDMSYTPTTTDEKSTRVVRSASPKATVKNRFLSAYSSGRDVDSSASARSVTGVSGVLDESPETPSANKEARPADKEVRPTDKEARPGNVRQTPVVSKNEKTLRPVTETRGSTTIEQFLFGKTAGKKGPSGTESATLKSEPVISATGSETEKEFAHHNDKPRRSFSGFSQGSLENDYGNEVTDDQDESDIKIRDSNDSNSRGKESFFKEII
ncbi:hypothetical protein N7582_003482 [Saccharomyces uvarum]|uniref:YKL050C-like protein n=1 Tax=Saccharomyces uvarum TaxID=230603 RepID=A0AA35NHF1_SACUV|nr:hypothetical protein N7582_003482 [Saccharomyces uvarum]CAI4045275.1 hypothetical protein SUVC_11G1660 [Saccharomyces uvarum]